MVVGEAQVLGQFRDAHQVAREAASLDARLDYVMRRAVSAGKRVRTETALGRRAGSIADAAVDIARELGNGLEGRGVLVLGAGAMSTRAAQRLHHAGARLMVASRRGESALALAQSLSEGAAAVTDAVAVADEVDLIICSTNSAVPVLTAADVNAMQERRGHRPLGIVDIAVPRDVEAAAGAIEGVTLIDVDAVGERIPHAHGQQRAALAEATAIIEAEVAHAVTVVGERDTAGPTIGALVRRAEAVRRREVERTLARMPGVDAATADRIHQVTRSIVSKLLHAPISHLRDFADDPGVALTLRDAFDLDAPQPADGESGESSAAAS
jgi:glutamyl-tRNA reductase